MIDLMSSLAAFLLTCVVPTLLIESVHCHLFSDSWWDFVDVLLSDSLFVLCDHFHPATLMSSLLSWVSIIYISGSHHIFHQAPNWTAHGCMCVAHFVQLNCTCVHVACCLYCFWQDEYFSVGYLEHGDLKCILSKEVNSTTVLVFQMVIFVTPCWWIGKC